VLIARSPMIAGLFPQAVVAGADGSPASEAAVAVARSLAVRYGVPLSVVTALGGKDVDLPRARMLATIEDDGRPVHALVGHGAAADLLVVGSRGLHGVRALGSVSERVAHQARCSVLVVRGTG